MIAAFAVAVLAALYGAAPAPEHPEPLPTAVPGGSCPSVGLKGAHGDRAYVCDLTLHWRAL